MRFGVSDRTKLRIVVPNYLDGLTRRTSAAGFGDVALGMKQQLGPLLGGFVLSVIVAVRLARTARSQTDTSAVVGEDADPIEDLESPRYARCSFERRDKIVLRVVLLP